MVPERKKRDHRLDSMYVSDILAPIEDQQAWTSQITACPHKPKKIKSE